MFYFNRLHFKKQWPAIAFLIVFSMGLAAAQTVFVTSRNTHEVKLYNLATGGFIKNFVTAGSGGLSYPQEVVWHPDGFLLVTGRGNGAVKKYDGATGAYLGNFTSGYTLDNPTKMTVWRDSLLYISQWGVTQNKVVRFDLKTGEFVDEFTSIGVPAGSGHAWDAAGNLYVAQYGNGVDGKVQKFAVDGTFAGTFVSSSILQGPVNLWFDAVGNLFVADWTLGEVLQFDGATGAFQSKLVTGLQNIEGFDFDSQGNLYLCDWTANRVFKFDFATNTLAPFIQTGGLQAPNSILIREPVSGLREENSPEDFSFFISPNPASEQIQMTYFLKKAAEVRLDLLDPEGRELVNLFAGKQSPGLQKTLWNGLIFDSFRAGPGIYFVRLRVNSEVVTRKIIRK